MAGTGVDRFGRQITVTSREWSSMDYCWLIGLIEFNIVEDYYIATMFGISHHGVNHNNIKQHFYGGRAVPFTNHHHFGLALVYTVEFMRYWWFLSCKLCVQVTL